MKGDRRSRTSLQNTGASVRVAGATLLRVLLLVTHRVCSALAEVSGGQCAMVRAKMRTGMWVLSVSAMLLGCSDADDERRLKDSWTCYVGDIDGDGFWSDSDCDDGDPDVYPDADELCNEIDDDCDGEVDEGAMTVFYADADGDGYGDASSTTEACDVPSGLWFDRIRSRADNADDWRSACPDRGAAVPPERRC